MTENLLFGSPTTYHRLPLLEGVSAASLGRLAGQDGEDGEEAQPFAAKARPIRARLPCICSLVGSRADIKACPLTQYGAMVAK